MNTELLKKNEDVEKAAKALKAMAPIMFKDFMYIEKWRIINI